MTGVSYLGGFVGIKAAQDCWLGNKVYGWRDSVATLARVAHLHLQIPYAGLLKFLHQKWAFV